MLKILSSLLFLAVASVASASTPAAWAKLDQEVTRKCIEASEYRRPRVSNPIVFDDKNGNVALIVMGIYPQSRIKGATGTSLCLYNRNTRIVVLEEASGWSASRAPQR